MTHRDATIAFLCLIPVAMGLWSLCMFCFSAQGNEATLSKVMLDTSREYPGFLLLFGIAVGILFGHWFLPQSPPNP